MGVALKVLPLARARLLFKLLPAGRRQFDPGQSVGNVHGFLHLRPEHLIRELELALRNLNDLLNKAGADLFLNIGNPVQLLVFVRYNLRMSQRPHTAQPRGLALPPMT